jgi:uncharacterized protein YjbJ (UPF0337 family)
MSAFCERGVVIQRRQPMNKQQRAFNEFEIFLSEEINHQIQQEETMKSSMKDKVEGTFHEAKGKVKEVAGKITDNPKLAAEGTGEKIAGKVQGKIGQVEKVFEK